MKRILRLILSFASVFTVLGYASACTTGSVAPPSSPLTEAQVQVIAGPICENMFLSMGSGNYTAFTRDFTDRLKKNLSASAFEQINDARVETIGNYISKEFWMMSQKSDQLNVAYRAKFTDEPAGVTLTLVLKNTNGRWLVDGYIYDSPRMRQSNC